LFLPIGDTPNPKFTPWVNYALLAANIGVFLLLIPEMSAKADASSPLLAQYIDALVSERGVSLDRVRQMLGTITAYDLVVWDHGYRPIAPSLVDALTAMFLHGGWSHLLGNMLFLWIYGDNVEHHLGRWQYLLFYIGAGVLAALGDGMLRPGSAIPSVGASGAISGVLGAYFLWFPQNRVRVFVFLFPFIMRTVEIPARWVLGAYVLFDNVMPLLFSGGSGAVSHGAHLGGFAAGVTAAWLWSRALDRPEAEVLEYQRFDQAVDDPVAAFHEALGSGWLDRAASIFFSLPRATTEERINGDAKLDLANGLEADGNLRASYRVLERVMDEHRGDRVGGEARTAAGRLLLAFGMPVEAFQLLQQAARMPLDVDTRAEANELAREARSRLRVVPADGWFR